MTLPPWAPSAHLCGGHPRSAVAEMVLTVVAQIRAPLTAAPEDEVTPVRNPNAVATDARPVLALWRTLGRPDPAQMTRDLVSVARAARWAPDAVFAREIRAEGWPDGMNRARMAANIARQGPPPNSGGATWDERLEAARAWEAAGQPLQADTLAPGKAATAGDPLEALLNALADSGGDVGAWGDPAQARRVLDAWYGLGGGPSMLSSLDATARRFAVRDWAARLRAAAPKARAVARG